MFYYTYFDIINVHILTAVEFISTYCMKHCYIVCNNYVVLNMNKTVNFFLKNNYLL